MSIKKIFIFIGVALFFSSCIFQNDPLRPNKLPVITEYYPPDKIQTVIIPGNSLDLHIEGVDPEGGKVSYSFAIVNLPDGEDSILCKSNSLRFTAEERPGLYNVEGRVHDSDGYSSRNWFINVKRRDNDPHTILEYYPSSNLIQCGLGDTIRFDINRIEDDHPADLMFKYLLEDSVVSEERKLEQRFMENGSYHVMGIVYDIEYEDTVKWEVNAAGIPDTIPPACITDLSGRTGESKGSVFIEWTAPGDDGNIPGTRASFYDVRTSTVRIVTDEDWINASEQSGTPAPSPAGEHDSMVINGLEPGEKVYVYVRAVDDFLNSSSICGSSPHLQVRGYDIAGRVINAGTGEGVEGALIKIGNTTVDTSGTEGRYKQLNNRIQYLRLRALDENSSGIGNFYDYSYEYGIINSDLHMDLFLVPDFPLVSARDERYVDFLDMFMDMTAESQWMGSLFKGWDHWPLKVYNPAPAENDTVDLQKDCWEGLREWEVYTGLDLFEIVDSAEDADVEVFYDYTEDYGNHHVEITELNQDGTPARKIVYIYYKKIIGNRKSNRHVVYVHEFGHILGLYHSIDSGHIMIGLTSPFVDHASTDEVNLVKTIYHLPAIFDNKQIVYE